MKYLYPLLAAFIFIPLGASAQSIVNNPVDAQNLYANDYDILALDFILNTAASDSLTALTLSQAGSARYQIDFNTLTLWADEGDSGFQGIGYDKVLSIGEVASGNTVFSEFNYEFTLSQRFFVSFDTGPLIQAKNLQLVIDPLIDKNSDGLYQSGDEGVFFSNSGFNTANTNSAVHFFKSQVQDQKSPKGYISNVSVELESPTMFSGVTSISFSGLAKDRHGNNVKEISLLINDVVYPVSFQSNNLVDWAYSYTPILNYEELVIKLSLKDDAGFTWESGKYHAVVDNRVIDFGKSSLESDVPTILSNGTDKAIITFTAKDIDGNLLSNRDLVFSVDRPEDVLSQTVLATDDNGKAELNLMSDKLGEAVVTVKHNDIIVANLAIQVAFPSVDPAPDPTPTPDPDPITDKNDLKTGDLIKGSYDAVYYVDSQSKRHAFFNQDVYASWFGDDFSAVKIVTDTVLASVPLGSNVTYRPGRVITSPSINEVYIVDIGRNLRHISSEALANSILGAGWSSKVVDIQDSLLFSYNFGTSLESVNDINISEIELLSLTIDGEIN